VAYKIERYGWVKDEHDARDLLFEPSPVVAANPLPQSVDLRPGCPRVYTQGLIQSCTANSIAAAIEFAQKKQLLASFMPSRLFIYYNERVIEHTTGTDAGAQMRDGIKTVAKQGVPPETVWPYSTRLSVVTKKPDAKAYGGAVHHRAIAYHRISHKDPATTLYMMKSCLAEGYPFLFGFSVFSGFKAVKRTGVLKMPDPKTEKYMGGHAAMAVGYDDAKQRMLVRNSFGPKWGIHGYFWMPFAYMLSQLASDSWTIRGVTGVATGKKLGKQAVKTKAARP
jgi:C1A family cysteine protease